MGSRGSATRTPASTGSSLTRHWSTSAAANCPAEWHDRVAEAVAIARAHSDDYIRHRVEIQGAHDH